MRSILRRSQRHTCASSNSSGKEDTTWPIGIIDCAAGLQICTASRLSRSALSADRGASHQRDQFIPLAVNPHLLAFERHRQRFGHFRAIDAGAPRLGFRQLRPEHLGFVPPLVAHGLGGWLRQQNRLGFPSQAPQFLGVRPIDAQLDLAAGRRTQDEQPHVDDGIGIERFEFLLYLRGHRGDAGVIVDIHQDLAEAAVIMFRRISQQEPHLAAAQLAGQMGHAFVLLDQLSRPV